MSIDFEQDKSELMENTDINSLAIHVDKLTDPENVLSTASVKYDKMKNRVKSRLYLISKITSIIQGSFNMIS